MALDASMPWMGTPFAARGSAIRPVPMPSSNARPPRANLASRSTAGATCSASNSDAWVSS